MNELKVNLYVLQDPRKMICSHQQDGFWWVEQRNSLEIYFWPMAAETG